MVGADANFDEAIDLLAANPPRPQTPTIWDSTKPRRAVTDDEFFESEVLPSPAPQSIKADRMAIRAEPKLVAPDSANTRPPASAVTSTPPKPAPPSASTGHSEIGPIPTNVPIVSTASGTAGGHAISQARMGVEPAKVVATVKPSVSATLPPGALGDD